MLKGQGPVMACSCFISTVSNPRLRPSPAAKGEARRGKRHMPMKESGGTGPYSLMRPPPCRASEATAAQGHPAGCGKRPGAGYDEPPRMGLPAGCGKTWPCHGMCLFHLHSTVKVWPFSPVFPLAGLTAEAFCRLCLWNLKEKSINHFLGRVVSYI